MHNTPQILTVNSADLGLTPIDGEQWAKMPHAGFAGKFIVSDHGRRAYDPDYTGRKRKITQPYGTNWDNGYKCFQTLIDGKNYTVYAHRAVWEAFMGEIEGDLVVCHGNSDPHDNRLENLRADTQRSNCGDAMLNAGNLSLNHCCGEVAGVFHVKYGDNLNLYDLKKGWVSCRTCANARAWANNRNKQGYETTPEMVAAFAAAKYEQFNGPEMDQRMNDHFEAHGCYPAAFDLEVLKASAGLLPSVLQPTQGELDLVG